MPMPLPPTVGERLSRCGTHVEVWGIVPGADVTLEVGGTPQTLSINATATTFTVASLPPSVGVRARQRVGPDTSEWSNTVPVEDALLPPAPPVIDATIAHCAQCLTAWGSTPGSRIEITHGSVLVAAGEINRAGYACMEMKARPESAMQSTAITCGIPSPTKGQVGVYTALSPLPPPKIVEPVFECQTQVRFEQLVPGASVEVFVTDKNNVTSSLGSFCACSSNVNANVGHVMKPGDRLKAVQTMQNIRWQCEVRGEESIEVPVVPPDARIKPKIQEPVYEGDPLLYVTNQIEGGTITLLAKKSASDPEEELGARPSSEHPEVPVPAPLQPDQVLRVLQELCGVKEFSDPVTVQKRPPVIDPPRVRKPLFGCGEIVVVENVIPGAMVYVRQTPPNLFAPEFPIGKAKATGTSVIVNVYPVLWTDGHVTAYQEVGGKLSGRSPWVKVEANTDFLPPTVEPPALVGKQFVWLSGVVPGAHLRVFDRGAQIGSGSLPDTDGQVDLWWPVPDGAIITATQALCRETGPSAPRPAVARAACDGPPSYDPGKWNDGGQIQGCNNCYNYACDIRTDNFAQPGGSFDPAKLNCGDMTQRALSDGLKPCTTGHCHPCHHRVALVIAPGEDYHWYRQGADGMWSHKRGCQAAKNVDESNNPISDPATADRSIYTDFCGYFCVYKPDVHISGPGCKCWP